MMNRTALSGCGLALMLGMGALGLAGDEDAAPSQKADRIVVVKSARTLTLMKGGRSLKTYKVALGGDPVGPKVRAGDQKTPEREYVVDSKNGQSRFHLALQREGRSGSLRW
jgi:murein L,D-transpeptidase YafK